jgi:site-specific recombinase XerD
VIALPSFTAEAIRSRLVKLSDHDPDVLVFCNREGTPLTTANVRRQLRRVLEAGGIVGVHRCAAQSIRRADTTKPP